MVQNDEIGSIRELGALMRMSNATIAYTAFEISRMSGFPDYHVPHGNRDSLGKESKCPGC